MYNTYIVNDKEKEEVIIMKLKKFIQPLNTHIKIELWYFDFIKKDYILAYEGLIYNCPIQYLKWKIDCDFTFEIKKDNTFVIWITNE